MPLKMYQTGSEPRGGLANIKHIIAVAAGKGGVGKSTVTVQLARALERQGYSIGIFDADIYGPSIRRMLPEDRLPGKKKDLLVPALCERMQVLTMAYFRGESQAAAVRAPVANGVINQFLHKVDWGTLDFLLIDFPPGTGDIQLTLAQQARLTGAVMVTTPQEVAIMDVKKAISLFDAVKVPILGVIENMSYYRSSAEEKVHIFGRGGGDRLAREVGVPFLGEIPLDQALCESCDSGRSLFVSQKEQASSVRAFVEIAEKVAAHAEALKREGGVLEGFELIWEDVTP